MLVLDILKPKITESAEGSLQDKGISRDTDNVITFPWQNLKAKVVTTATKDVWNSISDKQEHEIVFSFSFLFIILKFRS